MHTVVKKATTRSSPSPRMFSASHGVSQSPSIAIIFSPIGKDPCLQVLDRDSFHRTTNLVRTSRNMGEDEESIVISHLVWDTRLLLVDIEAHSPDFAALHGTT